MDKIGPSGFTARDPRYLYKGKQPVQVEAPSGPPLKVAVQDISASGVALKTDVPMENGQFVKVHLDGVGMVPGRVARVYEGGLAVRFDERQEAGVGHLNSLA